MTPHEKSLHLLVTHCAADTNLAAAVGKLIGMAPKNEQTDLFVRFLYEFRYTPTDKSGKIFKEFEDEPKKEVIVSLKELNRFLDEHKDAGLSEDNFHRNLWDFICEKAGDDHRKKAIYLRACTMIQSLPYINKAKAMTMTQEEFEIAEAKLDPLCGAMIRHVGNQQFLQITEDASMFLRIIESGKDEYEKTILLSLVLMMFNAKIMSSSLHDLLEDDD